MVDHAAVAEAEFLAEEPYDANDPEQVSKARKRAGRERKEELEIIAQIMSLPEGRRWLYNKLVFCKTFTTPFASGLPDQTAFNSGVQAVGHQLQADIMSAAPQHYMTMCLEGSSKR